MLTIVGAILLGACASPGGGSSAIDADLIAQDTEVPAEEAPAEEAPVEEAPAEEVQNSASLAAAMTEIAQLEIDSVSANCAQADAPARNFDGGLLSQRTFGPDDLRCHSFVNADLSDAIIIGVDVSGADFTGANLRNATLAVRAVGATFSGADLTGANFTLSDVRGASFNGAILPGSFLGGVAQLTLADLSGATIGCNTMVGGPGMVMKTTIRDTQCLPEHGWQRITLAGDLTNADLTGFDFNDVVVATKQFAGAQLATANLAGHGVWPDDSVFVGTNLGGANLSDTGFYNADFTNANLSGAFLVETFAAEGTVFDGAQLGLADMTGFVSVGSTWFGTDMTNTVLFDASFLHDDFTGSGLYDSITAEQDYLVTEVLCPESTPEAPSYSVKATGYCLPPVG